MTENRISASLAENLLTLLCFDERHCTVVRASITPSLFESPVFREIAGMACDFIDQFGGPIAEHLPDHLEHILKGDDERKARTYEKVVTSLFESQDAVNPEYVIHSLQAFIRQSALKAGLVEAVEALDKGDVDAAELALAKAQSKQLVSFDAGLNFSDPNAMIGLLDELEEPGFDLNIKELDDHGIIPRRKEMMLFIAPRGRGKSWFLLHCAKQAIVQRWATVVITLEMSEKRYAARALQSFFSIAKRDASVELTKLIKDKNGRLLDVGTEIVDRMTLKDPEAKGYIAGRARREFAKRKPFIIKEFPTGELDKQKLEAYLQNLERFHNIVPDLLVIDYPDLMKHDASQKRVELGAIFEQLRGVASKRNAALVVASQGNRESEKATTVTGDMVAEDISKIATADVAITYSQTRPEKKLKLARLLVEKARNDLDKFSVLITQNYDIGQFALDSVRLDEDYWDLDIAEPPKKRKRDEDDDE